MNYIEIERIKTRAIISKKMLADYKNYEVQFDIGVVEDNTKKKQISGNRSQDMFLCPFTNCDRSYLKRGALLNHVRRQHLSDYTYIENFLDNRSSIKRESECLVSSLPIDVTIFRKNVLHILRVMERVAEALAFTSLGWLSDLKASSKKMDSINVHSCFSSVREIEYMITMLGYLRIYYSAILVSKEMTEDLYNYIYNKYEVGERKYVGLSSGLCTICSTRVAEERHHIIPHCYGGSSEKYNIVMLCKRCHTSDVFETVFKSMINYKDELLKENSSMLQMETVKCQKT